MKDLPFALELFLLCASTSMLALTAMLIKDIIYGL